jgi:hypothetical protein
MGGLCGFDPTPAGTATVSGQTPNDCKKVVCDGNGGTRSDPDTADLPNDNNQCTDDNCNMDMPVYTPKTSGACNQMGGSVCSSAGDGTCVQCNVSDTCPGTDGLCGWRLCDNHLCGYHFVNNDTEVGAQTGNDCLHNVCDGMGAIVNRVYDLDVPVDDGNPCTDEICTGGVPSHPTGPKDGAVCAGPQGGRCSAGACVPTFMVVRVGTGSAALTNAATAVFVERRYFDSSGALVSGGTTTLPTAVNGAQARLTMSGTAASEGALSLSGNGQYAILGGYDTDVGTANVANGTASMTVNRIIGRINASGVADTSTRLNAAFSMNNFRGACSSDGTAFWGVGAGGGTNGVHYITLGSTGGLQILTTAFATRTCQVVGGQLYGSSNNNPNANVFTIGTGTPDMAGQAVTSFNGMPTTGSASPYAFVLLDRDAGVPGMDTLYVADDRAVAGGGGIQRWKFDGTTWSLAMAMGGATFTDGLAGGTTLAVRGLTGMVTGNDVTLIATTGEAPPALNKIIMYVDVNGTSTNPTGTVLLNGTAAANTVFRGLSLAP